MDYFKHINAHIQGDVDIDAVERSNQQPMIISLGADDIVAWRNLSNTQNNSMELPPQRNFKKIALHPNGQQFLLGGGSNKSIFQYSIQRKQQIQTIHDSLGQIFDFKYSPTGRYISIASGQQKVVIIDTQNNRKLKCRPGHSSKVYNTFFSAEDQFVASIGQDGNILIYQIFSDKDPQEVFRTKFTNNPINSNIQGCFLKIKEGYKVFIPGQRDLHIVQQLSTRWEIKKSTIGHAEQIIVVQALNSHMIVTSCIREMCTWAIQTQQKLVSLQDFSMIKIIPLTGTFIGSKNDGQIYIYNRPLSIPEAHGQQNNQIETQQNESRIQFNNDDQKQKDQDIQLQYQNQQKEQIQYQSRSKKKIADKIIRAYPQLQLVRGTTFYDESRFVYMNTYGYIIQTREVEETSTYVQFNRKDSEKPITKLLFKNRPQIRYFDLNSQMVIYAGQTVFGVFIDTFSSWEKQWEDISGIALSGGWLAVANLSQIRFFDISGIIIRAVSFDRPIIAMQAYQNLLAVVYHESIPMYTSQILSMKLFNVSPSQISQLPDCQVPLTVPQPEQKNKGFCLEWFGFSTEGMIFSQDSCGTIRVYSLQTNEWIPLIVQTLPDSRKAWIIGIQKYQVKFWKTTSTEPQPTVRPRLRQKQSRLHITTLLQNPEQLQNFSYLLWRRFCLDHEMARWRLWHKNKSSRNQKHVLYHLSKSIMSEKQIYDEHLKLDIQLYSVIKFFIKSQQIGKALGAVKGFIRTIQAGKNLVDLFDQCNYRAQAIELQSYYQQKQRQLQYEAMQELALKELKSKVQTILKAKKHNPMDPKNRRDAIKSPIPSAISSQASQHSSVIMEDITHKSQQSSRIQDPDEFENPFLKKNQSRDKNKMIEQHIEKYAVKKKVDEKKINRNKM